MLLYRRIRTRAEAILRPRRSKADFRRTRARTTGASAFGGPVAAAAAVVALSLSAAGPLLALPSDRAARARAVELLEAGRSEDALAAFDSLLVNDLSDLGAGYLAALAEAEAGRPGRARCRWLEIEGLGGEPLATMARVARRNAEQRMADLQLSLGASWFSAEASAIRSPGLVLLPLESLGGDLRGDYYGLAWSYLLFDALRGSRVCPAPLPSTLLALDLVTAGRGVRLPSEVARLPLNTVLGLRGRLALLPSEVGGGLLESTSGEWDDALRDAIQYFQSTQGLPADGEADPQTQQRLETVFRAWLETPPPPLAPNLLPRVLTVVGSGRAVLGTYRIEEGAVSVQMSVVDGAGQPVHPEPILLDFPLDETAVHAQRAADRIARLLDGEPRRESGAPDELGFQFWNQAARARLLFDRGLSRMESRRWEDLPGAVRSWTPLRALQEDASITSEARSRQESAWRETWVRESTLDWGAAHDAFLQALGAERGRFAGPAETRIIGSRGRIRIRGELP